MFELVYFGVDLLFLLLMGLGSIWYIYHISALCWVTLTIFGINFFLSRGTAKIRPLKLFPVLLTYIWAASVICMILSNSGYWQDCYSPRISPLYCTHIEYGAFFFTHLAALATALYLIVFSKLKRRCIVRRGLRQKKNGVYAKTLRCLRKPRLFFLHSLLRVRQVVKQTVILL